MCWIAFSVLSAVFNCRAQTVGPDIAVQCSLPLHAHSGILCSYIFLVQQIQQLASITDTSCDLSNDGLLNTHDCALIGS